jgi:hypothetical protein
LPNVKETVTSEKKHGISSTTEISAEVTASLGVSIEGLFDFGLEAKGGFKKSTTIIGEDTETISIGNHRSSRLLELPAACALRYMHHSRR